MIKRRIKQNIWGNWNGYEGTRKVIEFGTDDLAAQEWLQGIEPLPREPLSLRRFDWQPELIIGPDWIAYRNSPLATEPHK